MRSQRDPDRQLELLESMSRTAILRDMARQAPVIAPSVLKVDYGNLHREDGPAKELADGGYEYFLNGLRHRDGGQPAVVHANGDKMWYENDKLHRNDGPAVEKADGFEWWQGGEKWLQGSTVTPQIQEEKKAAALEKVVEQATVTDEKVQVLAPIKFKKPGSTPTP